MLLSMTIENFKSVKTSQTIRFEAVRDSRLDPSKVVAITDKMDVIKTSAVIGPNGAGKSSFVRALESLKRIVTSPADHDNPLSALAGTVFQYGIDKKSPCTISIDVLLEKGNGDEENPTNIGRYTLVANKERIYEESLYFIVNGSKKLMFERKENDGAYDYRFGKLYRGEKKRAAKNLSETRTFLAESAQSGGPTSGLMYSWFTDTLNILPMGTGQSAEQFVAESLQAHPGWSDMLVNYLWALDITDVRRVGVREREDGQKMVVFSHVYVNDKNVDGYSWPFLQESLSHFLDRICDQLFIFQNQYIIPHIGGYSENIEYTKQVKEKSVVRKEIVQRPKKIKLSYNEKKELEQLETLVPSLEENIQDIDYQLNTITNYEKIFELTKQRENLLQDLETKEERWMELLEKQEQSQ